MKIGGIAVWLVIAAIISWVVSLVVGFFGIPLSQVVIIPLSLIGSFLIIYFYLAPRNLWFTFVKEGTAKVIVKGDEVVDVLIQWKNHTLDKDWNVVEGREYHPLGGLRYYGAWPLYDVYIYKFKWTGVTEDGKVDPHPKETLDYILLKEDVYWAKVDEAEDIKQLPLNIRIAFHNPSG